MHTHFSPSIVHFSSKFKNMVLTGPCMKGGQRSNEIPSSDSFTLNEKGRKTTKNELYEILKEARKDFPEYPDMKINFSKTLTAEIDTAPGGMVPKNQTEMDAKIKSILNDKGIYYKYALGLK